ncbi:MAG: acyltransferase [Muribaculaceae bacterium]|nr:acyltransferase [Muribaculaceae bacterium]
MTTTDITTAEPRSVAADRKRIFGFDLLRALAIIMVMIDHGTGTELSFEWREVSRTILSPDAVLFIMLSGALLLPVEGSWTKFICRRFKRILPPFLFWTILWIFLMWIEGRTTTSWAVHMLKWSWLTPFYGSAWFIFIILGLYLFMPFMSAWIRQSTRRQLEFFLILWMLGGLCRWMNVWMWMNLEWNYFSMFINYFGYCVAGYYFVRYPLGAPPEPMNGNGFIHKAIHFVDVHRTKLIVGVGLLFGLALPIAVCFGNYSFDIDTLVSNNESFTTYLWGILIFALVTQVRTLGSVLDKVVRFISDNSYGIYLNHTILMYCVFQYFTPEFACTSWMIPVLLVVPLLLAAITRRIPIIGAKG